MLTATSDHLCQSSGRTPGSRGDGHDPASCGPVLLPRFSWGRGLACVYPSRSRQVVDVRGRCRHLYTFRESQAQGGGHAAFGSVSYPRGPWRRGGLGEGGGRGGGGGGGCSR